MKILRTASLGSNFTGFYKKRAYIRKKVKLNDEEPNCKRMN